MTMSIRVILLLAMVATSKVWGEKMADIPDGDRSIYVHRMPLLDENKRILQPDATIPFNMAASCDACHSVDEVRKGLHFNMGNPDDPSGRMGEPWIYVDAETGTQIPAALRRDSANFHPEYVANAREFIERFGRHLPGGIEPSADTIPEEADFWKTHGGLEINCMACHDAEFGHDQAEAAEHIERGNFRWSAVATCAFARVKGRAGSETLPPQVWYDPARFDPKGKITLDIVRKIPEERCYFCHSYALVDDSSLPPWQCDEEVHLTSGLSCTDCHRNGLDHRMVRGYRGEAKMEGRPDDIESLTCEGCHLGDMTALNASFRNGRSGAPRPEHYGIPPAHFDKLSCTACHSGPWPADQTRAIKTSRAHALGLHSVRSDSELLPHITGPVFAPGHDGKLTPQMLFWPAYWAQLESSCKEILIEPDVVRQYAGDILRQVRPAEEGRWPHLNRDVIIQVLTALKPHFDRPVVYIAGGRCYALDEDINHVNQNAFSRPVLWPWAHNVRPAQQSLGVHGCEDCHTADSPFFFGQVAIASPTGVQASADKLAMSTYSEVDARYMRLFNRSFIFRPVLKAVCLLASAFIFGVLLLYGLRALCVFCRWAVGLPTPQNTSPLPKPRFQFLVGLLWPAVFLIAIFMSVTGIWAVLCGEPLSGYTLMAHFTLGPIFAVCMALLVLLRARQFVLIGADRRFIVLVRNLMFWLAALATLPVILSITVSMFDWFGTESLRCWIVLHRYSSIALGVFLLLIVGLKPLCSKKYSTVL
ncbi:MAG: hypothetical protein JW709_08550 [Sedimentisphaerales bacterium]|nr:hypothetical protein [Sedimentisphaerales bacterium]